MISKATIPQVKDAIVNTLAIEKRGLKKSQLLLCVTNYLQAIEVPVASGDSQVTHCLHLLLKENRIAISPQTRGPGNRTYCSISEPIKIECNSMPPIRLLPMEFVCFSLGGPLPN